MAEHLGMERLAAAMAAWLRYRNGEEGDRAEFLSRHQDLRDLLEPLLDRREDDRPSQAARTSSSDEVE